MARPRDPTALKALRGNKHLTKDELAQVEYEIYVAEGVIEPPEELTDESAVRMFKKNAAYMERVNHEAGFKIYGDTDIEALTIMVCSYQRFLYYQGRESRCSKAAEKQVFNNLKNKEAMLYDRYLRLLKLDPGARVDFGLSPPGGDDDEF